MVTMFLLWALYFSLVSLGQNWFSFGWESQLLETGFLAIWSVPLLSWTRFPNNLPSPQVNKYCQARVLVKSMVLVKFKIHGQKRTRS